MNSAYPPGCTDYDVALACGDLERGEGESCGCCNFCVPLDDTDKIVCAFDPMLDRRYHVTIVDADDWCREFEPEWGD